MTAALEEMEKNVLYYENMEGGHGGSANNEQAAFMSSLAYTFLWEQLQDRTQDEASNEVPEESSEDTSEE